MATELENSAPSNAHRSQLAENSSDLVDWIWQALSQMYGPAFLSAYGEKDGPPTVWRSALSKLTRDEAKTGLANLARQARDYPANLTQVIEACRPKSSGVRFLGQPVETARYLLDDDRPKASRATVDKHLASMRALFK